MGMQTDVKATKPLTSSGDFEDQNNNTVGPCRVKGIYTINAAAAGSVVLRDGASDGPVLWDLATPTQASLGALYIELPGEGIRAETSLYGVVTGTTSVVVVYG